MKIALILYIAVGSVMWKSPLTQDITWFYSEGSPYSLGVRRFLWNLSFKNKS